MAQKVWGGSMRPRTYWTIFAAIIVVANGVTFLAGIQPVIIAVLVASPLAAVQFGIDTWLWEQRKRGKQMNAATIEGWTKWACIAIWAVVMLTIARFWPSLLQ